MKIVLFAWILPFSFCFLSIVETSGQPLTRLRQFPIHADSITLSGFSAGGTFAQQLQISYSTLFSGIAVFGHAYYRCGPGDGSVDNYDLACTILQNPRVGSLWDPENATRDIQNYFTQGLIENPVNLRNKKLYVYAGTKSFIFSSDQSLRVIDVYERYISNPSSIFARVQPANLVLPTNHFGGPCGLQAPPENYSIANCGLSGPFDAPLFVFHHQVTGGQIQLQALQSFDQTEFVIGIQGSSDMDTIGFFYIPSRCNGRISCNLHFYFHGCGSGRQFVGENHIRNSGFLEIAEQNDIIMVFPQAVTSVVNPTGCWDTFGATGRFYATQRGAQVTAVKNMIDRIVGSRRGSDRTGHPL